MSSGYICLFLIFFLSKTDFKFYLSEYLISKTLQRLTLMSTFIQILNDELFIVCFKEVDDWAFQGGLKDF